MEKLKVNDVVVVKKTGDIGLYDSISLMFLGCYIRFDRENRTDVIFFGFDEIEKIGKL